MIGGGMGETAMAGENNEKLRRLLMDYYAVTGQRIGVFDADFHMLMAYPEPHCALCSWRAAVKRALGAAREWDNHGMREAKRTAGRWSIGATPVCWRSAFPCRRRGGGRPDI